ncbi:MAG: glycosyltransferase family 9 protein [Fimbriimonadaceae bacterium]|nr:glycosyltransferase family 9 protein [Fimbriimonadaceae bacterium]
MDYLLIQETNPEAWLGWEAGILSDAMSQLGWPDREKVKRILFFPPTQIGDAIHLTAACRWIKQAYPESELSVVTLRQEREIYARCPFVDFVLQRPRGGKLKLWRLIRSAKPDLALSSFDSRSSLLWTALAGVRFRAWPKTKKYSSLATITLKENLPGSHGSLHQIEQLLGQITDIGDRVPSIQLLAQDHEEARAALAPLGDRPIVAIMVGSSHPRKTWLLSRFRVLWQSLEETGYQTVLLGGPAEQEMLEGEKDLPPVLAGHLSLAGGLAFLAQCRALITNDTGLSHCAGAVGCPVVALFGPTLATDYPPPGENHSLIQGECDCPLRSQDRCAGACMESITPGMVLDRLSALIP